MLIAALLGGCWGVSVTFTCEDIAYDCGDADSQATLDNKACRDDNGNDSAEFVKWCTHDLKETNLGEACPRGVQPPKVSWEWVDQGFGIQKGFVHALHDSITSQGYGTSKGFYMSPPADQVRTRMEVDLSDRFIFNLDANTDRVFFLYTIGHGGGHELYVWDFEATYECVPEPSPPPSPPPPSLPSHSSASRSPSRRSCSGASARSGAAAGSGSSRCTTPGKRCRRPRARRLGEPRPVTQDAIEFIDRIAKTGANGATRRRSAQASRPPRARRRVSAECATTRQAAGRAGRRRRRRGGRGGAAPAAR